MFLWDFSKLSIQFRKIHTQKNHPWNIPVHPCCQNYKYVLEKNIEESLFNKSYVKLPSWIFHLFIESFWAIFRTVKTENWKCLPQYSPAT